MIGEPFNHCVCIRRGEPHSLCNSQTSLIENGLEVCFTPKKGEVVYAIAFDGCVVKKNDPNPKCDGVFLLHKPHEKWVITIELKGSNLYRSYERQVYKDLVRDFKNTDQRAPKEISFIISNRIFGSLDKERLNRLFKINVKAFLRTEASKPPVNLRLHIN
jgi:hypothetical protein